MKSTGPITLRQFLGFLRRDSRRLLGWGLVEIFWQQAYNQGIHMWVRPVRGWGYVVIAALCSLSIATVALAVVRFRDLPNGEHDDSGNSLPQ